MIVPLPLLLLRIMENNLALSSRRLDCVLPVFISRRDRLLILCPSALCNGSLCLVLVPTLREKNDFYRHYHDNNQQPFHYDKHSKDKVLESMPYVSHCTAVNASTHYGPLMTWLTRTLDSMTTVASNRNHENKSALLRFQIGKKKKKKQTFFHDHLQDSSNFEERRDPFLSLLPGGEWVPWTGCLSPVSTVKFAGLDAGGLVGLSSSADSESRGIGEVERSE